MLPRYNENSNHISIPILARYLQYKQGSTYYYPPKLEMVGNEICVTFYRNLGNSIQKLSRQELIQNWEITKRRREEECKNIHVQNSN